MFTVFGTKNFTRDEHEDVRFVALRRFITDERNNNMVVLPAIDCELTVRSKYHNSFRVPARTFCLKLEP